MSKKKLNHKRRRKMRRKIMRRDVGWEETLISLTIEDMFTDMSSKPTKGDTNVNTTRNK